MEPNENALNIKVSTESLLKYALPTILSNVFMNVYSIVDQLFVSNLLGTDALSAVSIAGPFLAIALAIGTMIVTGGCALASNQMGEGQAQKARQNFYFFMLFSVFIARYSAFWELHSARRLCMRWEQTHRFTASVKPMPFPSSC